ncbi:presequence translocase-associated motor subunit Pam17 [Blumeria hordei DH14]|uniref:Presequence translocated-associated motor subunit PAM17 n=1 Tax=Blumeria graminis f. sp. hordei (strain DH14) TaxID=546991 RepID=N1J6S9_BLUG1|nr:presequence translocase-associated motor subunit Pam17 [Blumeria hordei DH14]
MIRNAPTRAATITSNLEPKLGLSLQSQTASLAPIPTRMARKSPSVPKNKFLKRHASNEVSLILSRYSSTAARTSAGTIVSAQKTDTPSQSNAKKAENSHLDWNTFFQLRKKRRWYQQGLSIGSSIGGIVGGAQVLTSYDIDALVAQFPLDPFISLGIITCLFGGVGWLFGPVVGTAIFNFKNRSWRNEIDNKEREFYKRVRKHRVDPSNSSIANPVPDYYGEKISSVASYRQWLKDCRAFNKKRTTYLE